MFARLLTRNLLPMRDTSTRGLRFKSIPANDWGIRRPPSVSFVEKAALKKSFALDRESSIQHSSAGSNHTPPEKTPEEFKRHRDAIKERFPEGWSPPRKLSREAMDGIRALHAHDPKTFSTPVLSERFRVSPEAVRRVLKSKWVPSREERAKLLQRERRRKEANIAKRQDRERWGTSERFSSRRVDEPDVEPVLPVSRRLSRKP